jgi:hypothetical protein
VGNASPTPGLGDSVSRLVLDASYRKLKPLPLLIRAFDDLQHRPGLNISAMDLPAAVLALQAAAAITLLIVLDCSLTQLAGCGHAKAKGGVNVQPDLQSPLALRALNFLFHDSIPP